MRIAIFGATGRTGGLLLPAALERGHEVRALTRKPGAVDREHERLTLVDGDATDARAVADCIAGVEAVVSVLGPTSNRPGTPIRYATEHIVRAMRHEGVHRLLLTAGAGVGDPQDGPRPPSCIAPQPARRARAGGTITVTMSPSPQTKRSHPPRPSVASSGRHRPRCP